jgi:hypothetical protein
MRATVAKTEGRADFNAAEIDEAIADAVVGSTVFVRLVEPPYVEGRKGAEGVVTRTRVFGAILDGATKRDDKSRWRRGDWC